MSGSLKQIHKKEETEKRINGNNRMRNGQKFLFNYKSGEISTKSLKNKGLGVKAQ